MAKCLIGIGSNQGDRSLTIDAALQKLRAHPAIVLRQVSSRHITQPIGGPAGQGTFVNAAALIETALPPTELLSVLQTLESQAGRTRSIRWDARPLDLDLLLYDDLVMNDGQLIVPHPRMAFRRFVLVPASEIAPEMSHPVLDRSITQLLEHLEQASNYVAITGVPGVGKSRLAKSVAASLGAEVVLEARPPTTRIDHAASRSLSAELEFLVQRYELLRGLTAARKETYTISDFWLGQSLAYAKELSLDDYRQVETAWLKYCEQATAPKLIVLLEANFEGLLRNQQLERLIGVQNNLREQLLGAGQSPTLTLKAATPAWNEEEVAAAILAM